MSATIPSLMSAELESDPEPTIGHVLLMDVVGYSKLFVDDQIALLQKLNRIVRDSKSFKTAEKNGSLTRLPTGDGMALLFFDHPESPVHCALEISQVARTDPQMQLRMGIHSGPIRQLLDVNDRLNVVGAGIDIAQRVLDCGDDGHILVSRRVAEDLRPNRGWHACLQDLGVCEVKHGLKLHLFNLCKDGVGNPALPTRVRKQRVQVKNWSATLRLWKAGSPARTVVLLAAFLCLAALTAGSGWALWHWASKTSSAPPSVIPRKSIAVLPFENLSDDRENAFFAEGVQDEILTNLAKVSDLKVISRTSVMQYRASGNRNLREIATALGVAHLLEGTVRRYGNRIRITAQLVDAQTDSHLWADQFEKDLGDIFAIQSEIAEAVVAQLEARLLPQEKAAIEEAPTANLQAYEFYVRGKALIASTFSNARSREDLDEGVGLLDRAVALDPSFFLAYYQLARAHHQIYLLGFDHTPARLALADAAVQAVVRLRPSSGEAHMALGEQLYWGYRKYDAARIKFLKARAALPNDPRPDLLMAYMDRRQGRTEESLRGLRRALDLDPRSLNIHQQLSLSYQHLRRYDKMAAILDRALRIAPDNVSTRLQRALVDLEGRADTRPLRQFVNSILDSQPNAATIIADSWLSLSLAERNPEQAERALAAMSAESGATEGVLCPRAWCVGLAARARGDVASAQAAFNSARLEASKIVAEQPDYAEGLSVLGLVNAALGRKDEAIRGGRRAVELLPITKDSIEGALLLENLAIIYAWTGEKDLALAQLEALAAMPSNVSYGSLRLQPIWEPLRGEPRFEKIIASLAPR